MEEPTPRPKISEAPLSVVLFANAITPDGAYAVQEWRRQLEALKRPFEIILLQGAGPEAPPEASPAISADRTIPYERTAGFRDALNHAIKIAQHPLLVFCLCDSQYSPADLPRLLHAIDNVDLVVGYRGGGQPPLWRVLLDLCQILLCRILLGMPPEPRVCWLGSSGWGRRWVAKWIFGVAVHDPECPYRLARRTVFDRIPIQAGGPFMPVEVLAKANHLGYYMAEEHVAWTRPEVPGLELPTFASDAYLVFRDPLFGPPPAAGVGVVDSGHTGTATP